MAEHVGPILLAVPSTNAVVAAICDLNEGAQVTDRGAYVRVSAPSRCRVTRVAIEEHLGRPFRFPGDLERIMTSFTGKLSISDEMVEWVSERAARER